MRGNGLIHFLLLVLCFLGFLCLALSMIRHQENLFGKARSSRFTLVQRYLGWGVLFFAATIATISLGVAVGLTAYSGYTSLGAGLTFLMLLVIERRRVH